MFAIAKFLSTSLLIAGMTIAYQSAGTFTEGSQLLARGMSVAPTVAASQMYKIFH
jgi:hypothetical protein